MTQRDVSLFLSCVKILFFFFKDIPFKNPGYIAVCDSCCIIFFKNRKTTTKI